MPLEFIVDLTRPEIKWNITPSEPDGDNMWYVSPPVLSLTEISPRATAFFKIDDNDTWMEIENNISLPPGKHSINMMAVDEAGNMAEAGGFDYQFDDLDPVASIHVEKLTYFIDEKVNISSRTSSDNWGPLLYKFRTSDGRESLWMDDPTWDFSFNSTGDHNLSLMVKDKAGRTNLSRNITISIIERPPPPEDDKDLVIGPYDPYPVEDKGWTDAGIEEKRFVRGGIVLILLLIITILLILVVRKSRIKDVDWEGEDDWLNEDWVDVDLDEEPVVEEDVLIFE
jgi:hypothetical protein